MRKCSQGRIGILYCGLMLLLFFSACKENNKRQVSPAFYHWKNSIDLSDTEYQYLSKLEANKIYLRFFDVDWQNNAVIPISVLENNKPFPDSIAIVPTVFITNRTLLNVSDHGLQGLGDKILKKIKQLSTPFEKNDISEVQFDCDWSPKTQKKYFDLLVYLKNELKLQGKKISATIRLHQIKYFEETGVPEVDRGVLMFYNMDDVDDWNTENSIINNAIAKKYLYNFDRYPLPLDLALPIFKWGIVFQDEKFTRIINSLDENDVRDSTRFIKIGENRFEVLKSTYLKGYYLYQNDQIRLEKVEASQLQNAAILLSEQIQNPELNLIFYHLDSIQIQDHPYEELKDICLRFY